MRFSVIEDCIRLEAESLRSSLESLLIVLKIESDSCLIKVSKSAGYPSRLRIMKDQENIYHS